MSYTEQKPSLEERNARPAFLMWKAKRKKKSEGRRGINDMSTGSGGGGVLPALYLFSL